MIGFENPTGAAVPATPVAIAETLHASSDLNTSDLSDRAFGDAVLTSLPGSRNDRTTLAMSRDGNEFDALVDAGLDVGARRLSVKLRLSDAAATSPLTRRTGFLPVANGPRRQGPVRDTFSPRPGLPTDLGIRNATTVTFDRNDSDAGDQFSRARQLGGSDPPVKL